MNIRTPTIIVGHYGSGKTEFAVNYALWRKSQGESVVLGDLDIVNPYFRTRQLKPMLEKRGIRLISSNREEEYHLDMPALAAGLKSCFTETERQNVVDVGGDPQGAHVLSRYAGFLASREYNMWIAVNANRPKTATAEQAMEYLNEIEAASKLTINGILNTTHLLSETSVEDILKGDVLVKELACMTGKEVVYTVISRRVYDEQRSKLSELSVAGELFPIKLTMEETWL